MGDLMEITFTPQIKRDFIKVLFRQGFSTEQIAIVMLALVQAEAGFRGPEKRKADPAFCRNCGGKIGYYGNYCMSCGRPIQYQDRGAYPTLREKYPLCGLGCDLFQNLLKRGLDAWRNFVQ